MSFNLATLKRKFVHVISEDSLYSCASIHMCVNTTILTCLMINIVVHLVLVLVDVIKE